MSSLNIKLSIFFDTHVSMFTFSSAITSSLLLFLLSVIPGESGHVSYMTDKSSCSIYKLKDALGHLCVMLTVQGFNPMFDLYPDPIVVISVICCAPFFFPIPSHSCDPLEDILPSFSQHGSVSVLLDDENLEF